MIMRWISYVPSKIVKIFASAAGTAATGGSSDTTSGSAAQVD
jgi:hypothetical protein